MKEKYAKLFTKEKNRLKLFSSSLTLLSYPYAYFWDEHELSSVDIGDENQMKYLNGNKT